MFPPGEEKKFVDSLGNLPENIESLLEHDSKFYEIIQQPGEALFVPSGWHHQVFNIENTISVNHNWINSCNIDVVWNYLKENLDSVEKEIQEFSNTQGWTEHCQLMLKALFGMDISDFVNFLKHIGYKRILSLETFHKDCKNDNHIRNDLNSINNVLNDIISEIKSRNMGNLIDLEELIQILEKIDKLVKNL